MMTVLAPEKGLVRIHGRGALLSDSRRVAMEYFPMGGLPTLSWVDAGTKELVESLGVSVESSAELAQAALCRLNDRQLASHRSAT